MAKVWKVSPGQSASHWPICSEENCIVIGFREVGDYRQYDTVEEIVEALGPGPKGGTRRGSAQSVWDFANEIREGHVVVANEGLSRIVGIGIVRSDYLPAGAPDNPTDDYWLPNARLLDWVVEEPVRLRNKHFFADQTVWLLDSDQREEIKRAFLRKGPAIAKRVANLLDGVSVEDYPENDTNGADESDIEGLKSEFRSLKSKRSRWLRNRAFGAANGICAVCRRNFARLLDGDGVRVLEVHHLRQLSSHDSPVVTKMSDLVVVCANCHLLLHLDPKKPLTINKLRDRLKKEGYLAR